VNKKSMLVVTVLCLLFSVLAGFSDCFDSAGNDENEPGGSGKLTLEKDGGIYVVLDIIGDNPSDNDIDSAIATIKDRLKKKGYRSASVIKQSGPSGKVRIRVEIPGVFENADEIFAIVSKPAKLEFRYTSDSEYAGKIIIDNSHVKRAFQTFDSNGSPAIGIELTQEGKSKFSIATGALIGKSIDIYLDNEVLSQPVVNQTITGNPIITGGFTVNGARDLAMLFQGGALCLELTAVESVVVNPLPD